LESYYKVGTNLPSRELVLDRFLGRRFPALKSTVRKMMATGTVTYNALRTKTLKERMKIQRKIVSHSNSTRAMLLV